MTKRRTSWLEVAEAGGILGIRFFVVVATAFGRAPARFFLRLVTLYYVLTRANVRHASRAWLEKVSGQKRATFGDVYRHLLSFAEVSLDRLFLARRELRRFVFISNGDGYLRDLADKRRGAILLGAHLGSFEALRAHGDVIKVPINIVGYFRNARFINAVLEAMNPGANLRVIHVDPTSVDFVLKLRNCVERGEFVAILGDRIVPGAPSVAVDFLGSPAHLPSGAYRLAAALGCPVYLTFGIYRRPNRYELHCEPFAERIVLPRAARASALAQYAQAYARRVEHFGRLAPDNWFNFFDFWAAPKAESPSS